jgi:DMSO/TMAO reductase YedYZ molybdopterin-dependent catalytic subunit
MSRPRAAVAGVVAAIAALGVSELLAGLLEEVPSLILGVAELFVDETPGGIVRWSIDLFGGTQKTLLVIGIVVVTLALGALFGVITRRSFATGAAGFVAFGIVGAWATGRGQLNAASWAWIAAFISAGAGIAVLWLLTQPAVASTEDPTLRAVEPIGVPDRRRFLVASGTIAAVGAVAGAAGRSLRQSRSVEGARSEVAAVLDSSPATIPAGVTTLDGTVDGISPLVTPNADFYRIDTRLVAPQVDPAGWTLRIKGMVDSEVELTFDDLLAMDHITEFVTLSCVSNEVGGDLVGNALWTGIPLAVLLDRARPHPDATQIVGRSVDGWTAGFPTATLDGNDGCMVAIAMNGEPLPVRHGFPARLVIPGLYGYVSATKWLSEIELTTWDAFDGYWIPRGWSKEGPIKTQSRIDVPRSGANLAVGRTAAIAGVAWAPTRGIERVEVRIDDEPWQEARLSGALSSAAWVQWVLEWDPTPGEHRIQVRATDGTGDTQTEERTPPAPNGASGYHSIRVEVR